MVKRPRMVKRLSALTVLGVGALLMSGCSAQEALRFGWPEPVTPEGKEMLTLWQWACIVALAMGVLVWGLIFWTITFHRRKKNATPEEEFPRQTAYNVPLELAYTAIPFIMIAVLFYFTVIVQNTVLHEEKDPTVRIDVTGQKWNWKFGYNRVALDGSNGEMLIEDGSVDAAAVPWNIHYAEEADPGHAEDETEHVATGPAGGKDQTLDDYLHYNRIETQGSSSEIPVLVLPTDTRVEFRLNSADVVHSFWVPEFVFKRDVMSFPERNQQHNTFQIEKITRTGAFVGRCAEMCGERHYAMNFEIRAITPDEFTKYIELRNTQGLSNAQALEAICQVPYSVVAVPYDNRRVGNVHQTEAPGDRNNTKLADCTPSELPQTPTS